MRKAYACVYVYHLYYIYVQNAHFFHISSQRIRVFVLGTHSHKHISIHDARCVSEVILIADQITRPHSPKREKIVSEHFAPNSYWRQRASAPSCSEINLNSKSSLSLVDFQEEKRWKLPGKSVAVNFAFRCDATVCWTSSAKSIDQYTVIEYKAFTKVQRIISPNGQSSNNNNNTKDTWKRITVGIVETYSKSSMFCGIII